MIRQKINEMKQAEKMRKNYGERKRAAEAELSKRMRNAPQLSAADRDKVNECLVAIQKHNAFTFEYQKELSKKGVDYSSPLIAGSSQYENANRQAMKLKKEIKRILEPYQVFWHEEPDPETLVFTKLKKHRYAKPDKEVSQLLEAMDELRNYGEEEMHQLKKSGASAAYLLDIPEKEFTD